MGQSYIYAFTKESLSNLINTDYEVNSGTEWELLAAHCTEEFIFDLRLDFVLLDFEFIDNDKRPKFPHDCWAKNFENFSQFCAKSNFTENEYNDAWTLNYFLRGYAEHDSAINLGKLNEFEYTGGAVTGEVLGGISPNTDSDNFMAKLLKLYKSDFNSDQSEKEYIKSIFLQFAKLTKKAKENKSLIYIYFEGS